MDPGEALGHKAEARIADDSTAQGTPCADCSAQQLILSRELNHLSKETVDPVKPNRLGLETYSYPGQQISVNP